jgi:hypothetical protein
MAERLDTDTKRLRLLRAEFDATLARMIELQRELSKESTKLVRLGKQLDRADRKPRKS